MIKAKVKKMLWVLKGGYKPKSFWDKWSQTFMEDPWQVATHKQHGWLLEEIKKESPYTILEAGVGFGRNIKFLLEHNISATISGVDVSPEMIKKAKKFVNSKNVRLQVMDVNKLSFNDKSFDLVFTHGVLMHIPQDKVKGALREISRVARKHILLIEQNYGGNEYTFIHNYRKILKDLGISNVQYRRDKKLGLDFIKIKI